MLRICFIPWCFYNNFEFLSKKHWSYNFTIFIFIQGEIEHKELLSNYGIIAKTEGFFSKSELMEGEPLPYLSVLMVFNTTLEGDYYCVMQHSSKSDLTPTSSPVYSKKVQVKVDGIWKTSDSENRFYTEVKCLWCFYVSHCPTLSHCPIDLHRSRSNFPSNSSKIKWLTISQMFFSTIYFILGAKYQGITQ